MNQPMTQNNAAAGDALFVGWTTFSDDAGARHFAREIVESRLAACAQVSSPVESSYVWEGKFCAEREWRVTVKFLGRNATAVATFIRNRHPYAVPQWVAVRADYWLPEYLEWTKKCAAGDGDASPGG